MQSKHIGSLYVIWTHIYVGLLENINNSQVLWIFKLYKFNIEGFSIWFQVKKVLHFTFLVIRGTCCSHESWHFTRMDNNILCLSFYIIESINEGGWLWGKHKTMFSGILYKIDIDVNLFQIFSHPIIFLTIKSLVGENWTFRGLHFFQLETT